MLSFQENANLDRTKKNQTFDIFRFWKYPS